MNKRDLLALGKPIITSEKGNSMTPLVKSGQKHELTPCTIDDVDVGDIVHAKVHGRWFTHLVTAKNDQKGAQISNNHGHVNGWTKNVVAKLTKVL